MRSTPVFVLVLRSVSKHHHQVLTNHSKHAVSLTNQNSVANLTPKRGAISPHFHALGNGVVGSKPPRVGVKDQRNFQFMFVFKTTESEPRLNQAIMTSLNTIVRYKNVFNKLNFDPCVLDDVKLFLSLASTKCDICSEGSSYCQTDT